MSETHQMPGYRPSALGLATKARIGEPGIEMSAYLVVRIICLLEENLAKRHEPVNSSSDSVVSFSLGQLHSLAALLNKLGDQSRPSGLVARSDASAIVAMKVLMEIDEVAPVWIVLKFLKPAINREMSIA